MKLKNDIGIQETVPFSVEILSDPEDRQLLTLENSFLAEIGEEALTGKKHERLTQAIRDGRIVFFIAKQGCRWVGMCSVSRAFPPLRVRTPEYLTISILRRHFAGRELPGC